jgi:hypothetical protein
MSLNNEKHLLVNQLQIKPYDFIEYFQNMPDEAILKFLAQIFTEGELDLFHNLILFLGQEHQTTDSLYSKVLKILLQYHDDIYFYVLDNLVPIIFNYHLVQKNSYFHISVLHLSNYEPLLVKAIHFIEKVNNLPILILAIKNTTNLNRPLIYTIRKYDSELADYIQENIYHTHKIKKLTAEINDLNHQELNNSQVNHNTKEFQDTENQDSNQLNNISIKTDNNTSHNSKSRATFNTTNSSVYNSSNLEKVKINTEDQELKNLSGIPDKIIIQQQNLVDKAIDNLSNFADLNHISDYQQNLENNINNITVSNLKSRATLPYHNENEHLNTELISKVKQKLVLDKSKKITATNFEEFINNISPDKLNLISTFMRKDDNDAYILLAKNKKILHQQLNPSCSQMDVLVNNQVAISNKLGTNYKMKKLSTLESLLRPKNKKSVLYFDIYEALLCQTLSKKNICEHQNVYSEFFYPYQKNKFGMKKQLYNLDVWQLLLDNIFYHDKLTNEKLGNLKDLYQIVLIVPYSVYQNLVSETLVNHINVISKNNIYIISAQDKLTPSILSFYLYSKFFQDGDLLLSSNDYKFIQHGEGISINGKFKYIEEFLPFIISDMEMLKQTLTHFYENYEFLTQKIELGKIKKKKFSKKKTILQKKQSKSNKKKPEKKEKDNIKNNTKLGKNKTIPKNKRKKKYSKKN